ncbi:MAG: sulfite exporter TauE/SafE family protein [Candidatus Geothermarchaeales archaeon]
MVTLIYMFLAFAVSVGAGVLGALLGLGGGVFLVPILIFLLGVPTRMAIGASIVAVVATSSAAAATYVRDELTNMRLGMFLELATTVGAITGAFTAHLVSESVLQVVFGIILLYASYAMFRGMLIERNWHPALNDSLATKLKLNGRYHDDAEHRDVSYGVARIPATFGISYLAGMISGLLGIGGGAIKVPAMNSVSKVPIKVAVATSSFMIGVTAAASAVVYFNHQNIHAFTTAPVVLGVLIGASLGARLTNRIEGTILKKMFVVVLLILAAKLILTGMGVTL